MPPPALALTWESADPDTLARFWAALLDRPVAAADGAAVVAGETTALDLRFVPGPSAGAAPNLRHLHLTSTSPADQRRVVAAARDLGARPVDVGQRPEEGHVVLADPDGHPFCVIEPGNAFLAGCGFLGELACEGTREVGRFWGRALGWPLVWDSDGETAVQHPDGGTKVAWGGPPLTRRRGRDRQRFHLLVPAAGVEEEVARLVGLGARRRPDDGRATDRSGEGAGPALLTDPDGNAFAVGPG